MGRDGAELVRGSAEGARDELRRTAAPCARERGDAGRLGQAASTNVTEIKAIVVTAAAPIALRPVGRDTGPVESLLPELHSSAIIQLIDVCPATVY
jgi:hypothetical protein